MNTHEPIQPVSFAGAVLDPYRHVCAFINSRDEEYSFLDPLVMDAITRGEMLSFIVDPAERTERIRHFRKKGLDMGALLDEGQILIRTWTELDLHGGIFDIDAMLNLSEELMRKPQSPRIRMVSDMGWAANQRDSHDLVEYEARANALISRYQHVVICVYDTAVFGGDVMINVLRTHPMVLIGGVLQINPFFESPELFIEDLRQRASERDDSL